MTETLFNPPREDASGHQTTGAATTDASPATSRGETRALPLNHADYWAERRRYLARIRRVPELRQRFVRDLALYLLRRAAWSFGFFPVVLAFWLPLVLSSFNPVVMAQTLLPWLQSFVAGNPEVQANTLSTLVSGWVSVGLFFMLFDLILTPFHSPFQREADAHMGVWSRRHAMDPPDEM